jgi:hypothetical protein
VHFKQVDTRERVRRLLSVSYHAGRLGEPVDERGARRYDWRAVQRFYDQGNGVRACQERFGFSRQTWTAAVNRGAVVARPQSLPLEELCIAGVLRGRRNVKQRLITAGVKANACEVCGIESWRGERLSLALHHVNGDGRDNRIANLQLLCPNCHSQTCNYGGRRS